MTKRLIRTTLTLVVLALAAAASLAGAATPADPQQSSNWAGYAIARTDLTSGAPTSFHAVSGSWTEPVVHCTPGKVAYSAFWIGLGGAAENSPALEQIGTSADCNAKGKPVYYVWYEMVPAASVTTKLKVFPGNKLHAIVVVDGSNVTLRIQNLTRHTSFTKRLTARVTDVSSAEWIAEAPSSCNSNGNCRVLPLSDFGTVQFTSGLAVTTDGRTGAIASSEWDATPIQLTPDQFARNGLIAVPSELGDDGASFSVSAKAGA
jgi:hypothetical protein